MIIPCYQSITKFPHHLKNTFLYLGCCGLNCIRPPPQKMYMLNPYVLVYFRM